MLSLNDTSFLDKDNMIVRCTLAARALSHLKWITLCVTALYLPESSCVEIQWGILSPEYSVSYCGFSPFMLLILSLLNLRRPCCEVSMEVEGYAKTCSLTLNPFRRVHLHCLQIRQSQRPKTIVACVNFAVPLLSVSKILLSYLLWYLLILTHLSFEDQIFSF